LNLIPVRQKQLPANSGSRVTDQA